MLKHESVPMTVGERTVNPRASGTTPLAALSYQPALDGIRAVAVVAVLLYHAGVAALPGGFLGVDLFFVLSGYLITSLLVIEYEHAGHIGLRAFWLRRARRLLPALCVVLVATAFYAQLLADPKDITHLRGDNLATLFYVSNWWFIFRGSSYWEQFTASPLRHTWSLAIEEQWYILWPIVLIPILRLCRGRMRGLSLATTGAALCSALLMAMVFDPMHDPSRPYYGTDTRAQALLLGAALAFVLRRAIIPPYMKTVLKLLGGVGAIVTLFFFAYVKDTDGWMYRGGFTLVAGAAAALIAGCVQPGRSLLKSTLSLAPLVLVGRVSYGLYLYHWPTYVVLSPGRTNLHGAALITLRLAATFVLAGLSYRFVEMPVRRGVLRARGSRHEILALATMVAATLGIVLVAIPAGIDQASLTMRGNPTVRPGNLRVLVIGDSVAGSLAEGFNPEKHPGLSITSVGFPGCGVMRGRMQLPNKPPGPPSCLDWDQRWAEELRSMSPDLSVVLVGAWESWDRWVDDRLLKFGTPEFIETLDNELDKAVALLRARGSRVVVVTPPCFLHFEAGVLTATERHNGLVRMFEDYGRRRKDKVTILDLAGFVCPGGNYRGSLNGIQLHKDGSHFTKGAAEIIWDWLAPQLLKMNAVDETGRSTVGR